MRQIEQREASPNEGGKRERGQNPPQSARGGGSRTVLFRPALGTLAADAICGTGDIARDYTERTRAYASRFKRRSVRHVAGQMATDAGGIVGVQFGLVTTA